MLRFVVLQFWSSSLKIPMMLHVDKIRDVPCRQNRKTESVVQRKKDFPISKFPGTMGLHLEGYHEVDGDAAMLPLELEQYTAQRSSVGDSFSYNCDKILLK